MFQVSDRVLYAGKEYLVAEVGDDGSLALTSQTRDQVEIEVYGEEVTLIARY